MILPFINSPLVGTLLSPSASTVGTRRTLSSIRQLDNNVLSGRVAQPQMDINSVSDVAYY